MAEKKYVSDNAQLLDEWNWERNQDVKPNQLSIGSHKKVWWKCSKGHEWQAVAGNRNKGCGCPYCTGRKALLGFNDLTTLNPILASEWNYDRNGNLKPEDFTVS